MNTVEYIGLSKQYGRKVVLDNVNMSIPENSIFFLLGLNGAGKTTLLKSTVGMISYSGEIRYNLGKRAMIGAVIESPCFFEELTGYENLEYHAIAIGCDKKRIIDAMTVVGLDYRNKKAVKKYSLGMKQRLGIARAILSEPELIILDEPLNGLDPAGIKEIKQLIRRMNQQGVTFLISSHLIRETSDLATDYAILDGGQIKVQFSHAEMGSYLTYLEIKGTIDTLSQIANSIQERYSDLLAWFEDEQILRVVSKDAVNRPLVAFEAHIKSIFDNIEVSYQKCLLDEYFLALTGKVK